MSVDQRAPKGYRKEWGGGNPPAPTVQTEAFEAHLDACRQCREHPFDLCVDGARLLREAVAS